MFAFLFRVIVFYIYIAVRLYTNSPRNKTCYMLLKVELSKFRFQCSLFIIVLWKQLIIKVREWISCISPLTKTILLNWFLDIVPSSTTDIASHGGSVDVVSFRFKAKENLQRCEDVFFDLIWYLNERRLSPAQAITIEWTVGKYLGKRVQSKQTSRDKLGNRVNRWSKVQADTCYHSSKTQFKQQRQRCQCKSNLIFILRISRELNFIEFVYTVRNIPNWIYEAASKFGK